MHSFFKISIFLLQGYSWALQIVQVDWRANVLDVVGWRLFHEPKPKVTDLLTQSNTRFRSKFQSYALSDYRRSNTRQQHDNSHGICSRGLPSLIFFLHGEGYCTRPSFIQV